MKPFRIGVLSLGGAGVAEPDPEALEAVHRETVLLERLRGAGHRVVSGGLPFPEPERIGRTPALVRRHVHTLMDHGVGLVLLCVTEGPGAADVLQAAGYLERELGPAVPLLLYADTTRRPSPMPALLRAAAVLRRGGFPHAVSCGDPSDAVFLGELLGIVAFHARGHGERDPAGRVAHELARHRILVLGPPGPASGGELPSPEVLAAGLGVAVVTRRRDVLDARIETIAATDATDPRLEAAARGPGAGDRDARRGLAAWLALGDLARDAGATAVAVTDAGGLERAVGWCCDVTGPGGRPCEALPVAPAGDVAALLAQLVLWRCTRAPAGHVRLVGLGGSDVRLDGACLPPTLSDAWTPGARLTLARFDVRAHGLVLHAREVAAGAAEGGTSVARLPADAVELLASWPGDSAAVAAGWHAPALAGLAHRRGVGFDVRDGAGRRFTG